MIWDVYVENIRQTIHGHEQAMVSLDEQIEGHMRAIRQLHHLKQQHINAVRHCKGKITLAKRLPFEVLATIFKQCVCEGWTRTPLVVSHVCSSWRQAASAPTVWSHIYVNLEGRDPCQRTRFWLSNAQDTLLTVEVEVGNEAISNLDGVMKILTAEIHRWKILIIKSTLLGPVNQILGTCIKPTPELRTVDISVAQELTLGNTDESQSHQITALQSSFPFAPIFRALRISRNFLPHRNMVPSSITDLSLKLPSHPPFATSQSISSVINLLGALHKLVSFSIEVPNGHYQNFELDISITQLAELPSLTLLVVTGWNNIFGILSRIITPSLKHLHLRSSLECPQAEETSDWIYLLLKRSSPPISVLELRDMSLDPQVYGRLFALLPNIEELRLHDSDLVDPILKQVNGPEGLCPLLRRIDMRWCGRLSGGALVELVQSRLRGNIDSSSIASPISEITLINCPFVKEEHIVELAQMTTCRLIHRGQEDFCYTYGCCGNERYRKRLKQRLPSYPLMVQAYSNRSLIL
ncbi:hypothetical protein M413DRAFT_441368 [Hebeloma cylindrosporum]|uniref:Uncharacterized protein n=1 Tax=Hebeloma cylindrosporum TaxID=76867 RepID=A0A0C3CQX2_HEBCY|nr:hypothetical protein M413DRAFT_441368 [Hebeloma cylindrosporum h7]